MLADRVVDEMPGPGLSVAEKVIALFSPKLFYDRLAYC
jgi:hypothetical protein